MNEELRNISKMMIAPLLSRAGKAIKLPMPKRIKQLVAAKAISPQPMTMEKVQLELKKIESEKLQLAKDSSRPKLSSCFTSVSRSSNVLYI